MEWWTGARTPMTNKFGLDPESKEKALKVFRYQMTWPILWFERFSGCKEDNGFEGVNLEKVVFIIEQREDDIWPWQWSLHEPTQPRNESTTSPAGSQSEWQEGSSCASQTNATHKEWEGRFLWNEWALA